MSTEHDQLRKSGTTFSADPQISNDGKLETVESDGEMRIKGYGFLVYGAMMCLGGAISARERPAFILLAVFGFALLVMGLRTLTHLARRKGHLRRTGPTES